MPCFNGCPTVRRLSQHVEWSPEPPGFAEGRYRKLCGHHRLCQRGVEAFLGSAGGRLPMGARRGLALPDEHQPRRPLAELKRKLGRRLARDGSILVGRWSVLQNWSGSPRTGRVSAVEDGAVSSPPPSSRRDLGGGGLGQKRGDGQADEPMQPTKDCYGALLRRKTKTVQNQLFACLAGSLGFEPR